ncbi:MAG: radical SAM protein [Candidatus Paceibacterota bacterium]
MFATPIVKPIDGLCNLSCKYCYMQRKRSDVTMSEDVLEKVIKFFSAKVKDVEFIWHGGEPLMAGIDFFKKAVEIQKKIKNVSFHNVIQTNGTLVNKDWAEFFNLNNFTIGVSLDGSKKFHDYNRYYCNGLGSFDKTMEGINILKKYNVFAGIICGVSEINISYPKDLLHFFIDNNITSIKFMLIKNIGHYKKAALLYEQYYDFLIQIFDEWISIDDVSVNIQNIQTVVNLLLGGIERECVYMGKCSNFVTVYSDGAIYACDSFPKKQKYFFGNIITNCYSNNSSRLKDVIQKRKECCKKNKCNWFYICQGGCSKDFYGNLSVIKPKKHICLNQQKYFAYIKNTIDKFDLKRKEVGL